MSRGRANVWEIVWNNFVKSLKPRQRTGTYMGEDYFGNKYYEIPAQPQIGKRRPERWFVPTDNKHDNFDKELTAEWESWLRHRRYAMPELNLLSFTKRLSVLFLGLKRQRKPNLSII